MNSRKLLLWSIFTGFAIYSTWVLLQVGYFGIWQAGISSPGSLQITLDLVIGCLLICVWMKKDSEQRGMNPYPWIVATIATGTLATLVYLILREYSDVPEHAVRGKLS